MPLGELEAGWYGFEVDVDLDGSPRTLHGDRRFSVAWPRGTMRTGTIKVDRSLQLGEQRVLVTRLQLASDATTLRLELDPQESIEVALRAEPGSVPIPVVEVDLDVRTSATVVRAYPVPRAASRLVLELGRGDVTGSMEVPLD
jgi:hypothetical protein